MNADINKIIIETILPFKLRGICVFGSYAHNEMHSESDIHIMVNVDDTVSLLDLGGLYMALSERLDRKIDFVTKGGINEIFRPYIEPDLISVY